MSLAQTYCYPGVIAGVPEAYHGVQPASSVGPLCAVAYTDDRVTPLCPCALPPPGGGALGWTLVALILSAFGVYLMVGVGYGRYTYHGQSGEALEEHAGWVGKTGLLLSSPVPDGKSSLTPSSHPHWSAWEQLPGLVADGWDFVL